MTALAEPLPDRHLLRPLPSHKVRVFDPRFCAGGEALSRDVSITRMLAFVRCRTNCRRFYSVYGRKPYSLF